MNDKVEGKFTKIIYLNQDNSYTVALFRVKEASGGIKHLENSTITISGTIPDIKLNYSYTLEGTYTLHPKFSWQFNVEKYTVLLPSSNEEIITFLSSPFVKGCGKKTASNIVELFGEKTLEFIKENYKCLLSVKGITEKKAMDIYSSILNFEKNDIAVKKLTSLGFTYEEASRILGKHYSDIDYVLEENLYALKDIIDFKKIDDIYKLNYDSESVVRSSECLMASMMELTFNEGSTYFNKETIYKALSVFYNINLDIEKFDVILEDLVKKEFIIKSGSRYYLEKYYNEEINVSNELFNKSITPVKEIKDFDNKLKLIESSNGFVYNEEQRNAIYNALTNKISIISGGPGTGKTTIINAICKLYIAENELVNHEIAENIALLAPTGRASKRLSSATGLPAYTIHRLLKWHKEEDLFEYNKDNKLFQKLFIIDESSMLDISLTYSLLQSIPDCSQIVFVGDIYQLPSVGPGLVLSNMIDSGYFKTSFLSTIYRQSDNSYIPYLASDIKNQNIFDDDFLYKRDDYSFITCPEDEVLSKIIQTCKYALSKGMSDSNVQILVPMYKGVNGIDNINLNIREIFNPVSDDTKEVIYNSKTFREGDKVLQLNNDSELGVFNGDIGYITGIKKNELGKVFVTIKYDDNLVTYEKKDLKNITHAYAISIHKAQGSEFDNVIIPMCKNYFIMLYNKLLYTAVSRAKKSLTIIGNPTSFINAVNNNETQKRNTSLLEHLNNIFNTTTM